MVTIYNIYIFELNAGAFILLERLKTHQAVAKKANHHVHVKLQEAKACESVVKLYSKLIQNMESVQNICSILKRARYRCYYFPCTKNQDGE